MPGPRAATPSLPQQWRAIVLFGLNVASYKFALAHSLLALKPAEGQLLRLEDLAQPFSLAIAAHLRLADKQGTSPRSRYLDACRAFNRGETQLEELRERCVELGFNHVISAFHVVGGENVPQQFFLDERVSHGGIRVTEAFSRLIEATSAIDLSLEVDSRWRLVETAWDLGVARSLVKVHFDDSQESFFALDRHQRRRDITSSRGALNGYQRGRCFYCGTAISIDQASALADVDHFFPHALKSQGMGEAVDGVWNLVLACRECNRGSRGKFARVPTLRLLERLHARNEYLVASKHPLRENILAQTGLTEPARRDYLRRMHSEALGLLIHQWEPEQGVNSDCGMLASWPIAQ